MSRPSSQPCRPRGATAWLAAALLVASWAGRHAAAQTGPQPGLTPDPLPYQVVEPREPWRAEQWPMVIALADPGTPLDSVVAFFSRLTRTRGALLLVLAGGDEAAFDQAVKQVVHDYPVVPTNAVLAARDDLAEWARSLAFSRYQTVAAVLSIDAPALELPTGTPNRADLKVALLVTRPDLRESNEQLAQALRRLAVPCALETPKREELARYVGAALSHLLPAPPAQTALADPITGARLVAVPGWEFIRHETLFATAHPIGDLNGPTIEVATGLLGKRWFEGYVEATATALNTPGIELIESTRITPSDNPTTAHAFYFFDRRGRQEQAVFWVLVGQGNRIVSFRCSSDRPELSERYDQIRQLALSVTFAEDGATERKPPAVP